MKEPDPKTFVNCHLGTFEFGLMPEGFVSADNGSAESIRLQNGVAGPKGWGYLHVIGYESRSKQLGGLGFPTFPDFVYHVATRYTHIYDGKKPGRYQLACHVPGYSHYIVVERVQEDGGFWTIVTGLPSRPIRDQAVWVKPEKETDGSEPTPLAPGPRRRFTTLSLPAKPKPRDSES